MNRIVLIGNGFDLAHGLPTKYEDFINDYWEGFMNLCIGQDGEIKISVANKYVQHNSYLYFSFRKGQM